jgi:hypothetical protein
VAELLIFKNDDPGFRSWVRKHPGGLVVNVPNLMLHHPDCDHISDLMTKAAKACADGPNAARVAPLGSEGKGQALVDL